MAIYHFSVRVIGRSAGRSSVAAAAYRAGERLHDARTGLDHDFSRKAVERSEILLPAGAPDWMRDRAKLWNAVEAGEKRKDAQLCRDIEISIPRELSQEQGHEAVMSFIQQQFVGRGMVADVGFHRPSAQDQQEQPHAHVLLTLRDVGPGGFGQKNRAWNEKSAIQDWREAWAEHANRALEAAGRPERIDHRSLADRGETREPVHRGRGVVAMERRGRKTGRGGEAREAERRNETMPKTAAILSIVAAAALDPEAAPPAEQPAPAVVVTVTPPPPPPPPQPLPQPAPAVVTVTPSLAFEFDQAAWQRHQQLAAAVSEAEEIKQKREDEMRRAEQTDPHRYAMQHIDTSAWRKIVKDTNKAQERLNNYNDAYAKMDEQPLGRVERFRRYVGLKPHYTPREMLAKKIARTEDEIDDLCRQKEREGERLLNSDEYAKLTASVKSNINFEKRRVGDAEKRLDLAQQALTAFESATPSTTWTMTAEVRQRMQEEARRQREREEARRREAEAQQQRQEAQQHQEAHRPSMGR